jgi:hypothetical protein
MSGQIFISYRREESRWSARSLHDRLCRGFDPEQIFMDIDAIALGEDFVKAIETTVAKCDVLIAVIGSNWLTTKDDHGDRRLDNPEDFVRMEIGAALKREITVIPVLVDGALMPRSTDLPEDLKPLVRRNGLRITDTSFDGDCQRLAAAIRLVLEKAATEQREPEEKQRLEAQRREIEKNARLEAEPRQREEQDRLEHVAQSQLPSPVAPSTPPAQPEADKAFAEPPKVVHPPPEPCQPERMKSPPPLSGGTGGKSPSKQVIAFLVIAAVLVAAGLVYLATRASQSPPPPIGGWVARHGLPADKYEQAFNDYVGKHGMQLIDVSGYGTAAPLYAALWVKTASPPVWQARHGLTAADCQTTFDQLTAQGYHPVLVNGYATAAGPRFACIFQQGPTGPWVARRGLTGPQYQAQFNELMGQGYTLDWVSGYFDGSQDLYAAIWRKQPGAPPWQACYGLSGDQYQAFFNEVTVRGYKPVVVCGYGDGVQDRYAAIFRKIAVAPAWQARHGLTPAQYQATSDQLVAQGYRLELVSGYSVEGQDRIAAIWTK